MVDTTMSNAPCWWNHHGDKRPFWLNWYNDLELNYGIRELQERSCPPLDYKQPRAIICDRSAWSIVCNPKSRGTRVGGYTQLPNPIPTLHQPPTWVWIVGWGWDINDNRENIHLLMKKSNMHTFYFERSTPCGAVSYVSKI